MYSYVTTSCLKSETRHSCHVEARWSLGLCGDTGLVWSVVTTHNARNACSDALGPYNIYHNAFSDHMYTVYISI